MSAAVNELVRAGIDASRSSGQRAPFRQQTVPLGLRLDVSNVGEALEHLDDAGPD